VQLRWGLIPFFIKLLSDVKGISTINAPALTVAKSPSYRELPGHAAGIRYSFALYQLMARHL
jgi:putative SOS response-associated peptidase YedK